MTPAYCDDRVLNKLEWDEGQTIQVRPETVVTPGATTAITLKAYFLTGPTGPITMPGNSAGSVAYTDDADDLRALRESLKGPGQDTDFEKVRKQLDL